MAKLSARGRKELARLAKEKATPDGDLTIWEKSTITLMSDGNVLRKLDCRFKPDQYDPNGRLHSYGWKKYGKIKAGVSTEQFVEIYQKSGYSVV